MKRPEEFVEAGCELSDPFPMFALIHQKTFGDPCKTGCAYFKQGQCAAFRKLFPDVAITRDKMRKEDERNARKHPQDKQGYVPPTKKPFRW